jgi:hypothetical protein
MGFFDNPGKAWKGFKKDPIGRIGKDLNKMAQPAKVFFCFFASSAFSRWLQFPFFHRRAPKGRMLLSCLERLGACSMAGRTVLFEALQLVPLMDAIKACTTTRCQNNNVVHMLVPGRIFARMWHFCGGDFFGETIFFWRLVAQKLVLILKIFTFRNNLNFS